MAIVIEEEKRQVASGAASFLGWLIILGTIAVGAYYIFFTTPPTVVVEPPPNYNIIAPIAAISIDPSSVLNSASYQALKQYIPEPTSTGPAGVGRPNPFVVP